MKRRVGLAVVLAVMLSPAPRPAAGGAPKGAKRENARCSKCRDTKRAPCPAHDRASRRYRAFCSACAEPACCKGVGWTPCARCGDDATREKFEAVAALYAKERAGGGFYPWGKDLFCAACEHYRFKAAATHGECHEFHAVAEKAFSLFYGLFGDEGVDELRWDEKGHFLIVGSRDQYHQFLEWYQQNRNANPGEVDFLKEGSGCRLITERLQVLIRGQTTGEREQKDLLLHRIAHGAGHLAIENYKVHGNTPAWLGEGWACRSEIEALGKPAVYCIQYVGGGARPRPPHEWRQTVRDAIRRRKIPSFETLFGLKVGDMGVVEWSMSISVVSWLLETCPDKAKGLVDALKEGKSSKAAFEAALQRGLPEIEKAWQRWAIAH